MEKEIVSSIISGGAALLGGTIGNALNYGAQQKANETNIALARETREWQEHMMDKQNAYNDPKAVAARLAGAGLNPNLAFGNDAASSMLASSAQPATADTPQVHAPRVDPMVAATAANIAADTRLKNTQADLNNANIDVAKGQVKVSDSVVVYNEALAKYTKAQQDYVVGQTEMLGTLTEQANSQIAVNYATIENMSEQRRIEWANTALKSKEVDAIVDKYAAEAGFTREQARWYAYEVTAKVYNINADSALKTAQISLTDAERAQVQQATENLQVVNKQLNFSYNQDVKFGEQDRRLKQGQMAAEILVNMSNAAEWKIGPGGSIRLNNGDKIYQNYNNMVTN